jgi:phosphoenolpyruvate carboxykinase (GTP)
MPLVLESKSWRHGVLLGATMASETTAAATGAVGQVRRDPMAMKPFCGYNFGDYWRHWLSFEEKSSNLPPIFEVNWFRKDADGNFMWPGFGENMRVLDWILRRSAGEVDALDSPIGGLPEIDDINLDGIDTSRETLAALLEVDREAWRQELDAIDGYLDEYGDRTPSALRVEYFNNDVLNHLKPDRV